MPEVITKRTAFFGRWLLEGELLFFLALTGNMFKWSIPTDKYIDSVIVFMMLTSICVLYKWIKKWRVIDWLPLAVQMIGAVILLGFMIVCTTWSLNPEYGRFKTILWIFRVCWLMVAAYTIFDAPQALKRLFIIWTVFSFALSVEGIFRYFSNILQGTYWDGGALYHNGIGNSNYLQVSPYITCTAFMCFVILTSSRMPSLLKSMGLYILYSVSVCSLVYYAARSLCLIFLFLLGAAHLFILIWHKRFSFSRGKSWVLIALTAVLLTVLHFTHGTDRLLDRLKVSFETDYKDTVSVVELKEELTSFYRKDPYILEEHKVELFEEELNNHDMMFLLEESRQLELTREEHKKMGIPISYDDQLKYNLVNGGALSRMELLKSSLKLSGVRTLRGWGWGSFGVLTTNRKVDIYPHIPIFELIIELGVFSLIPFVVIMIYPIIRLIYAISTDKKNKILPRILLVFILLLMARGLLADVVGMWEMYSMLAIACCVSSWLKGSKEDRLTPKMRGLLLSIKNRKAVKHISNKEPSL